MSFKIKNIQTILIQSILQQKTETITVWVLSTITRNGTDTQTDIATIRMNWP